MSRLRENRPQASSGRAFGGTVGRMPRSRCFPHLFVFLSLAGVALAGASPPPLGWLQRAQDWVQTSTRSKELRSQAELLLVPRQKRARKFLVELVETNSGSRNRDGIRAVLEKVEKELSPLGFRSRWVPPTRERTGSHLVLTRGEAGPHLLMVGHVDTIFEPDHPYKDATQKGDFLHGPGVRDMKGGLVVLTETLHVLQKLDLLSKARFTLVFNGDEETGSLDSRPLLESLAKTADLGLVYEGNSGGSLTTRRGGLSQGKFQIQGHPSHIASRRWAVDANQELAEKMLKILALNDPDQGILVNVAPISGGVKRNQVSGSAQGEIDIRFPTVAQGDRLQAEIRKILETPMVKNRSTGRTTQTTYTLFSHRPPFDETPEILALATVFQTAASRIGFELKRGSSSGGSDQNILMAAGLPTLDSLGIWGIGAHTVRERASLSSLDRMATLSILALSALIETYPEAP